MHLLVQNSCGGKSGDRSLEQVMGLFRGGWPVRLMPRSAIASCSKRLNTRMVWPKPAILFLYRFLISDRH